MMALTRHSSTRLVMLIIYIISKVFNVQNAELDLEPVMVCASHIVDMGVKL